MTNADDFQVEVLSLEQLQELEDTITRQEDLDSGTYYEVNNPIRFFGVIPKKQWRIANLFRIKKMKHSFKEE